MNKLDGKGIKALSVLGLIITTIIWGSAFVVMKNSVEVITPAYLLALRFTIASAALVAVFWKRVRKIRKTDVMCGGLLGIFLFISYLFQTYGLKYTTASKNAFITTLYVILVPFFHWFYNKKRPTANNVAAAVIAVFGLAFLSLEGDLSVNIGDVMTLVCGFFFAFHIVFIDRYTEDHDPIVLTVIQMIVAAILSWAIALPLEGSFDFRVIGPSMMTGLLYLGIFSTMLCFLMQNMGQKHLSPNTSSIILSFESVFGLMFSVIFLGDPVTLKLGAGCVLMFASVILSEYKKKGTAIS
ncbi:DMT family transporter [Lacrimispora indolis]|uniref:DMT family transporter n=1 Tax=Lacrimispora indolis TaxID=69825 RepID=UPI00041E43A9|nr:MULTISPECIES: DMT family transporter [Lachnospiraceae]MBE7721549.1 DMT family transporter [Lacrimispora celerecrescens]